MATVDVKIKGLDKLQRNLKRYPSIARPRLAQAINTSLAEVHKNAYDSDTSLFKFKTPRVKRTGFLALSFKEGIRLATEQNLVGAIGPRAKYAVYVHASNPFMERIAKASQSKVQEYFDTALNKITLALA